jgi:hypothetical protein
MAMTTLTELALRAAVNTAPQTISSTDNSATDIKTAALKRMQELLGGSNLSNVSSQINLQTVAITAAIQGIGLAFIAIKGQIDTLKDKRLAFDKERQAGIATFLVPTNKEETLLSKQERIMKSFIELSKSNPMFSAYFGIKTSVCSEIHNAEFYSVLPFYRMSEGLIQPIASSKPIDKERISISLFFKSALPEAIADIDNDFQNDYRFIEFWKAAFKKDNYLNDLRSQRFIMMTLANLLWNLQHPVDPETGFPLSVDKCVELCREIGLFLNKILTNSDKSYIKGLSSESNDLISYARRIEMHVKALRAAFVEEQLYELNINDLTNSAHHTLRIIDKSVLELIYKRVNSVTKRLEPDSKAAETLACVISELSQFFCYNSDLIKPFQVHAKQAKESPFLNSPPSTLLDAIIIFMHCSSDDKKLIFDELELNPTDSAIEFTQTLRKLYHKFIKPIKDVCKKELDVSLFNKKKKEVAILVARRLMPLITLVVEDYRVEVDASTRRVTQSIPEKPPAGSLKYRGKEQVQAINKLAEQGKGYYVWELSAFIELSKDTEAELDMLPKHQYRFTEITKLLDSVGEIVLNYRNFLQLKPFQDFLIRCLNKIRHEYGELERHIDRVDTFLSQDKSISRAMQGILVPMTKDINAGLDNFSSAFSSFEHTVSAPDFTENQKNALSVKIESIHQQFMSLFSEDSGILAFLNQTVIHPPGPNPQEPKPVASLPAPSIVSSVEPVKPVVPPKQVVALRQLINQCYSAMSYQSQYSTKGKLLSSLLELMNNNAAFTTDQLSRIIKEVARITLSYRPTYFFQAAYGETRSAKILIANLKDPKFNALLPISTFLFGTETDLSNENDATIVQRLRNQKIQNHWEDSCETIKVLNTF